MQFEVKTYLLCGAILFTLTACAGGPVVSGGAGVGPGIGPVRPLSYSAPIGMKEERWIGRALAVRVFREHGPAVQDAALQRYVALVGQAVAQMAERAGVEYRFTVLADDTPFSLGLPGGYVFVSRGMLKLLNDESQLAAVLGRAVAHISERHALATLEKNSPFPAALMPMGADGNTTALKRLTDRAAILIFERGLDAEQEFAADRKAAQYARRLGYHPGGLKPVLEKRMLARAANGPAWLNKQPGAEQRYRRLLGHLQDHPKDLNLPRFAKEYRAAVQGKLGPPF